MFHWPRITLTSSLVLRALGMGRSMVPSIQLKTVLLAQIASASMSTAVRVNPGLLRSCRKAKRKSWSSPDMDASCEIALGELRVFASIRACCAPKHG